MGLISHKAKNQGAEIWQSHRVQVPQQRGIGRSIGRPLRGLEARTDFGVKLLAMVMVIGECRVDLSKRGFRF